MAVEAAGAGFAAVAHLRIGVGDDAVGGHPLAEAGTALLGCLDVLGHHRPNEPPRLRHAGIVEEGGGIARLRWRPPPGHRAGAAGRGVVPVDLRLAIKVGLVRLPGVFVEPVPGHPHQALEQLTDEGLGVRHRPADGVPLVGPAVMGVGVGFGGCIGQRNRWG